MKTLSFIALETDIKLNVPQKLGFRQMGKMRGEVEKNCDDELAPT
jgi:hypothetical protein